MVREFEAMTRAQELRELIHSDDLLITPGVFDAFTAKLAEWVGFEAVYLGGYSTGASTAATEPLATATEMRDQAREIVHNTSVPLAMDGNAGFGAPAHTYRAVQEFAKTGVAAVHIEDQVYPKRLHYHAGQVHLIDTEEMVKKVEAAAQAVAEVDEDIVIMARSDAGRRQRREEEGETIEDAVDRVNAYLDAGAEVGMVFTRNVEEIEYAQAHIEGPFKFSWIESYDPAPPMDELGEIGIPWVTVPVSINVATLLAVKDMFENLQEEGTTGIDTEDFVQARSEIEKIIELPKYYDIEERAGQVSGELHHEGRSE